MVNVIDWSALTEDSFMDDGGVVGKVKAWVFVSFVLSSSGMIWSIWILGSEVNHPSYEGAVEPAVRGLLQNVFLFGSSLLFRAVRTNAES